MLPVVQPGKTGAKLALSLLFLVLLGAGSTGLTPAKAAFPEGVPPAHPADIEQVVVVKLRSDLPAGTARGLLDRLGITEDRLLVRSGFYVLSTESPAAAEALIDSLRSSPLVELVANDRLVRALDVPDDPDYPRQWHLHAPPGGMNAESAWDLVPQGASGVTVAVIDTGVAFETFTGSGPFGDKHFAPAPDLVGVPIVSPWNFLDGTTHANDDNGHGTHVASTIVQTTDNHTSGAGIASGASLMPLKVLDYSGNGTGAHLVEAIYYAVDNGADVINMSLGFPDSGHPEADGAVCGEIPGLHDALAYAADNQVVVVAAAGNESAEIIACPAAHPTVIAVGATDLKGDVTYYSNSGDALDITAPGGDPNADLNNDGQPDGILQQTYCFDWLSLFFSGNFSSFCSSYQAGTSMASPQVAAAAALLLAVDPQLTPSQVRYLLETTAADRGPAGWDSRHGYGALDAAAAVAALLASPPPDVTPEPYPIPTPYPRPEAPTNLIAATAGSGSVQLTWTDNSSNESGFRIEYAPRDGGFHQAGLTTINTYTVRGLTPSTSYLFRVFAYDSQQVDSTASDTAAATTQPTPAAPTDLVASTPTSWSINLTWTDNAGNETLFQVERSTNGADFSFAGFLPPDASGLTVTNLTPSTDYWFRVRAKDNDTASPYSNVVTATTLPPPEAPSDLQATATTASSISLQWRDNSSTEQGFKIEKSADGGLTFSAAGIVPANWTAYTVMFLDEGQAYAFRVRAYAGSVQSDPSNAVGAATNPRPAAPTDLTVVSAGPTEAVLAWTDNAQAGARHWIEKSEDGVNFSLTGVLINNASGYTVRNLSPETTYWFRVRADEAAVYSDYSNIAQTTTAAGPQAPTGLSVTDPTATTLTLNWVDTCDNEQGFRIEKSTDGGATFALAAIVFANQTSYRLTGLLPNTTYSLRLSSYMGGIVSAYSETVEASTASGPPAPSGLSATPLSATYAKLSWIDNSSNEVFFSIERSTDGTSWGRVGLLLANQTSYTAHSLEPLTTYQFRVLALAGSASSTPSNVAAVTTLDMPQGPSDLTATVGVISSVRLEWTDNSDHESGFQIERSPDGAAWSRVAVLPANWTSWNNFGPASQTTYYYRVRAYDGGEVSGYSNTAVITLP